MAKRSPPDPVYVLRGTEAAINVLKFAPKSVREGLLISGSVKGIINLWNLKTKRTELTLEGHDGHGILAADFLPCGRVISHGRDGYINTWECSEGRSEVISSIVAPFLGFCQFCILSREEDKSHWIAVPSSKQSQVNILDLDSKDVLFSLKPENEKLLGMCMCLSMITNPSTDKPLLIAGYENGQIVLWDIIASKVLSKSLTHSESVLCMDVVKENLQVVSGSADNKLCVTSITPQCSLSMDKQIELKNPGIASVKIRKDNKIMATGGWDGRLRIYNWKKLTPLAYLSYHTDTVNAVDFSEDFSNYGQLLAAGGKDSRISLWSLYNDK